MPQEMLAAGCDVVTFRGDKLLGGPQAGLIVGSKETIARIRKFPMKRALRISKLPLAALEATLMLYLRPERLAQDLPTLRLLTRPPAAIRALADQLLPAVQRAVAPRFAVERGATARPDRLGLAADRSPAIARPGARAARAQRSRARARRTVAALRALPLPVIGRIADDRLLLDLRCLEDPAPSCPAAGADGALR